MRPSQSPVSMDFAPRSRPTPPQLFAEFEAGNITRAQLQVALRWHHEQLLEEVEEAHEDPKRTWLEGLLARRLASRWAERHGERRLRHIFAALAELPDFEPAHYLWNALHPDVPLHCFFRLRRPPVIRLLRLRNRHGRLHALIEYGGEEALERDHFVFIHAGPRLEARRSDEPFP